MKNNGMFWPFRLLIAALMSIAILIMILGALNYFEKIRITVSMERLEKGFNTAWGAITTPDKPDKGINKEKNLTIPATTISVLPFAKSHNLDSKCIEMQSVKNSAFELTPNKRAVTVKRESVTDVYFLCVYNPLNADCSERCYISFGKAPEVE